jgi:flavin reductase (DIM6/NTAB) family NADH-FMN oxidoreductase RutF
MEVMTMDEQARKAVLRLFSYGMYVVTAADGDERAAFTANFLTQCAFDPPMVALAAERDSHSIEVLRRAGRFAVCVLPSGSRELAGHYGKRHAKVGDKLAGQALASSPGGCPVPAEALGYLECVVEGELPCGDHALFTARVVEAALLAEGEPLTMREAGFRHSG